LRAARDAPGREAEFDLAGRLAARYGEESFTGNIAWRHAKDFDEMLITTPLGQGVARIMREGDQVTLTTAEPREYHAADVESLTQQVLGFRLPSRARRLGARPALPRPRAARLEDRVPGVRRRTAVAPAAALPGNRAAAHHLAVEMTGTRRRES